MIKQLENIFLYGIICDIYKDSDIETHFFSFNNQIPENEFIQEDVPVTFKELKSFLSITCGSKNFDIYVSNKQYQDAIRGKFGGLNLKFFNLFKKAVTFTPIDDIEKFIVEYVCDVKNKIDITSMQENIRQYNNLSNQVEIMKKRENSLEEIDSIYNKYIEEVSREQEEQYLIWRAEKQILLDSIENLNKEFADKNFQKDSMEIQNKNLEFQKNQLQEEINKLRNDRAKSDIAQQVDRINAEIKNIDKEISRIEKIESDNVASFRKNTLKWNANIEKLVEIKNQIVTDELEDISTIKDLLKYLDNVNKENFSDFDINAMKELREKIQKLINFGDITLYHLKHKQDEDLANSKILEADIKKLEKGVNPYESDFLSFKQEIEIRLQEKFGKEIKAQILADLLEIKNQKWQNAIEGYLNTQKKYLIIEPEFFEEASKIYREMAKNNSKIHSFGLVDVEKISNEKLLSDNSLATEIKTENIFARRYIDYLLGRVIKCDTVQELRKNKIAITSDCMLYQGYVLRKINPDFYKYPIIGKEALTKQKEIKEKELLELKNNISNSEKIITTMSGLKLMFNYTEEDITRFDSNIQESKNKKEYISKKIELQQELDSMDLYLLSSIDNKIELKEKQKRENEVIIGQNQEKIGMLKKDLETIKSEKIPESQEKLKEKEAQIKEFYNEEWQTGIGEDRYGKESLKKIPEKIQETFSKVLRATITRKESTREILISKRSDYNTTYQLSYNIHDGSNEEFSKELKELKEIELPEYSEKIEDAREKAYEQFRIEFLDKLKSNIDEVKSQIKDLNIALGAHRFGTDIYNFKVSPKQEYKRFYNMITDDMLLGDWAIGQEQFNQKYSQEIKELFDKVTTSDVNSNLISDEEYEKNIKEYTDYRTYLNFDLIVKDKVGNEQRLSKTLLKKSGGETQTPFYISILASFAQLYRIKNNDNTIRLIVFDEAFSKMDSERIEESIKLLRKIGFQAIFAAPPEKLQDIQALVDSTLLVLNPEEHSIIIKKYTNKEESVFA